MLEVHIMQRIVTMYLPIVKQADDIVWKLIIAKCSRDIWRFNLVSRRVEQSIASIPICPVDVSPDASNVLLVASFLVCSRSKAVVVVSQRRPILDIFGTVMLWWITI